MSDEKSDINSRCNFYMINTSMDINICYICTKVVYSTTTLITLITGQIPIANSSGASLSPHDPIPISTCQPPRDRK